MTKVELRLQYKAETGHYPNHQNPQFEDSYDIDDTDLRVDYDKVDASDVSYDETEYLLEYLNWLENKFVELKNKEL